MSTFQYALDKLTKQLAFYCQLRADFLKSGMTYDAIIEGLEALARELGGVLIPIRRARLGSESKAYLSSYATCSSRLEIGASSCSTIGNACTLF